MTTTKRKPDFTGYATKYGVLCSDGRTIIAPAFQHQDKETVPLVWRHLQDAPDNILGHAILHHQKDGVRVEAFFNSTPNGKHSKAMLQHGDIRSLSIRAGRLTQKGNEVLHGQISEVSLVVSGANPEALIDNVTIEHSDGSLYELEDEAIIYSGVPLEHEDGGDEKEGSEEDNEEEGKTLQDVFETLNEEQKQMVYAMVGEAAEAEHSDDEDDSEEEDDPTDEEESDDDSLDHSDKENPMGNRNVFDRTKKKAEGEGQELTHAQIDEIFTDAARLGSLKESVLMHAQQYGITNIDMLFPEAKDVTNRPEWVRRDDSWVAGIINGVHSTPFSRIRSRFADLTHEEARAKGYIKGNLKKEQFFAITQRETTPKTIYKKQKLDRDDIIDVTDFDVVAWMKEELRFMLEEEIARAILIGDGREPGDEDKINETNIRPIAKDDDFYAHHITVAANASRKQVIRQIKRARRHYKGTGTPAFYTTEDVITDLMLEEDRIGRALYETEDALCRALRVSKLIPVEVMESEEDLIGIMVNIRDYTVGADKGGKTQMFDDFDIDYNQHKYLIETRLSGALTKRKSAVVVRRSEGTEVVPTQPGVSNNVVTIPTVNGVEYMVDDEVVTGTITLTEENSQVRVEAYAKDGFYIASGKETFWDYNYIPQD